MRNREVMKTMIEEVVTMKIAMISAGVLLIASASPVSPAFAAAPAAVDKARDKVVCKRQVETGSFAKAKKVCKTRYDWNRVSENSKQMTRDLQESGMRLPPSGG